MAHTDHLPGDQFSIDFRMAEHVPGCWYEIDAFPSLDDAILTFDKVVASDRSQGATIGARWRITHQRGTAVIQVIQDLTLAAEGLVTTADTAGS